MGNALDFREEAGLVMNPRGELAPRGFFVSDEWCQNITETTGARTIWRIKNYSNCWKKSMRI